MDSDSIPFDFGVRLRDLRKKAKLTQEQLAQRVGISRTTLRRYESSQSLPDGQRIIRLALTLHTTADYLLGLSNTHHIRTDDLKPKQAEALDYFLEQFVYQND